MKTRLILQLSAIVLLLAGFLPTVQPQSIRRVLKGHHRGTGAVELLLATGILAKLLNHRAKHGASVAGRHILHALLGGHRYSPAHHARYPLEMHAGHQSLLQEELTDPHASMASLTMPLNDVDLLMNQESVLFGARAPMLMSASMMSDTSLLAEAQLGRQLLAARRHRKLMEARKMLAAQEASLIAAQSEVSNLMAAQEAVNNHAFLSADQSRQVFTSIAPPKSMPQRQQQNTAPQVDFPGSSGSTTNDYMSSEASQQSQRGMRQGQQPDSEAQSNFQGSSWQGMNPLMGSESVHRTQSMLYSQQSPGHQGHFQNRYGSQGIQHGSSGPHRNYHSSSGPHGNYHGSPGPHGNYHGISGHTTNNFMSPEEARMLQAAAARSDDVLTIPPDLDDEDAAHIIASLHSTF